MPFARLVAPLFLLSIVACSGSSSSDTGPAGDTGDEQDVVTAGAGVYAALGPGPTGGTAVKLVNRATTKCSDGKTQGSCTIVKLDTSALRLAAPTADTLEKAFFAGHALVQGELTTETTKDPGSFVLPILKVTNAWIGAAGKSPNDVDSVYKVTRLIQNAMCMQNTSCNHFHEELVNSKKGAADIVDLDLTKAGAGKGDEASATDQTNIGAPGLLVVGINHSLVHAGVGTGVTTNTTLVASDFYLPVAALKN